MKYKISTERVIDKPISKEMTAQHKAMIEQILKDMNFDEIIYKDQVINYSRKFWKAGSNIAYSTIVSDGTIEFENSGRIRLFAYTSFLGSIIIAIILAILAVFVHWFLALGIVLLGLQLLFSVDKIRSVNEEIIDKVLEILNDKNASP